MRNNFSIFPLAAVFLLAASVVAQPPQFGRGGYGRSSSPEERIQRFEGFIRGFDTNNDGTISPEEVAGPRGEFFKRIAERAGVNASGPVAISSLKEAMLRQYQQEQSGQGGPPGSGGPSGPPGGSPWGPPGSGGPGFGPPGGGFSPSGPPSSWPRPGSSPAPATPGFGGPAATPAPSASSTSSSPSSGGSSSHSSESSHSHSSDSHRSSSSGSSGSSGEADERIKRYAESLMRQYDKNKNGRLEREEWSELRGSLRESDRNGDGIVTQEELAGKLVEYTQRGGSSRSGGDSRSSGSRDSRDNRGDSKSSIRFLTAHERLPKGLPDWFVEKDADEDGQVSMGEYASNWSDSVVQEFLKYDLNNDGIVTPEECLAAQPAESSRRR